MTRIAAQTADDFQFRTGDSVPIRTQKLEILRQQLMTTTMAANYTALSYILADGLQAINTPLFPDKLPPMTIGEEIDIEDEDRGFRYNGSLVLGTRDWLPVGEDRSFRAAFRARLTTDGTEAGTLSIGFLIYSLAGIYLGDIGETVVDGGWLVSDGIIDAEQSTTSVAILAAFPTAAYVRSYIFPESQGGTYVINNPRIEDITTFDLGDITAAQIAAEAAAAAALASATAAFGHETTAAGHATTATSQASIATGQASAALASAVAAQSYANDADTFATASNTSAMAAATSATASGSSASAANISALSAATQAANSATSATAANTSASSAATSSSAAGSSASAANTSALNAATSEGNASGFASAANTSASSASASSTAAGNSASAANTSAINAAASNTSSTTQAGIATAQAVIATAAQAAATASMVLTATLGYNSLNKNSRFADWPGGSGTLPADWFNWIDGAVNTRVTGDVGGYAYQSSNLLGANQGMYNVPAGLVSQPNGWLVVESEVTLVAGVLNGAGWYLAKTGFADSMHFASEIDPLTGAAYGAGTVGRRYKFSRLTQAVGSNVDWALYQMTSWSSLDAALPAKTLKWHSHSVRNATPQEIRDQTVLAPMQATVATNSSAIATATSAIATLNTTVSTQGASITANSTAITTLTGSIATTNSTVSTLGATVSTQATAITTLQGYTEARFIVTAVAGGRASLEIYADANGGGGINLTGDVLIDGDLLVTGSVSSTELAANSASNGGFYYDDTGITLTTSWQDVASVTLTTIGGAVKLDFAAYVSGKGESGGSSVLWRLLRGATEIRTGTLALLPGEQTVYGGTVGENPYPVYTPIAAVFPAIHVDTSGTTGSLTYKVQLQLATGFVDYADAAEFVLSATEFRR